MRDLLRLLPLVVLVTGCSLSVSSSDKPSQTRVPATATATAHVQPTATPRPAATQAPPLLPPTPRVVATRAYSTFVSSLCHALAARDSTTVINLLPYYQYNSGVRYGRLGDGEGQTGDPSLVGTWLAPARVRCQFYSPDIAGHGTILTRGWTEPGGWALIEADTFNGSWKINDFTFGDHRALFGAMQTSRPILTYRG